MATRNAGTVRVVRKEKRSRAYIRFVRVPRCCLAVANLGTTYGALDLTGNRGEAELDDSQGAAGTYVVRAQWD